MANNDYAEETRRNKRMSQQQIETEKQKVLKKYEEIEKGVKGDYKSTRSMPGVENTAENNLKIHYDQNNKARIIENANIAQ